MSPAFTYHDLTSARQGALSGLHELQQLSCQASDASLVHLKSFQFRRFDEDQLIERIVRGVGVFTQGQNHV